MSCGDSRSYHSKFVAIAAGFLLMGFTQIAVPLPVRGQLPLHPTWNMHLDYAIPICNLSASSDGLVILHGGIQTDMLPANRLVCQFYGDINPPWPVAFQPQQMVIIDTTIHSFNISITIPRDTPAAAAGILIVNAMVKGGDYLCIVSDNMHIPVNSFHRILLDTPRPYASVQDGKTTRCPVRITNLGNTIESIDIGPDESKGPAGLCWTIARPEQERLLNIPPGKSVVVNITFDIPSDAFSAGHLRPVGIVARSLDASGMDSNDTAGLLLFIHSEPGIWVQMEPASLILIYCGLATGLALFAIRYRKKPRPGGKG